MVNAEPFVAGPPVGFVRREIRMECAMYVRIRGKSIGPLDDQKVHELVRQGKISRASEVSLDGRSWVRAAEVPSIFADASGPSGFESMLAQSKASPARHEDPCVWYYSVDGHAGFGPLRRGEIGALIRNGTLKPDSLLWKEGEMADTVRYTHEFAEFLIPETAQGRGQTQTSEKHPTGESASPDSVPAPPARTNTRRNHVSSQVATQPVAQPGTESAANSQEPSWKIVSQTLRLGPWIMFLSILASIFVASVALALLGMVVFLISRSGFGFDTLLPAGIVLVMIAMMVRPLLGLWKLQTGITTLAVHRTETQLLEVLQRLHRLVREIVVHIILLIVLSGLLSLVCVALGGFLSRGL